MVEGEQCWLDQQASDLSQSSGGRRKLGRSGRERHAHRWPSGWGGAVLDSNTDGELWRAKQSFLGWEELSYQWGALEAENSLLRVRPIRALESGELIPQNEKALPPLRRERQAPSWALESGELIPQNERETPRSAGSGMLIDNPL